MKTVFDDKSLLEFFKSIQDVNEAQKELNHITSKRIALKNSRSDLSSKTVFISLHSYSVI